MAKVGVHHPVGEALSADTDALEYTVAGQLVHDEASVNNTCGNSLVMRRPKQKSRRATFFRLRKAFSDLVFGYV